MFLTPRRRLSMPAPLLISAVSFAVGALALSAQ
jgi:hypothetical protein